MMPRYFRAPASMNDTVQNWLFLLIGILLGLFLSAMFPDELHAPLAAISREAVRR